MNENTFKIIESITTRSSSLLNNRFKSEIEFVTNHKKYNELTSVLETTKAKTSASVLTTPTPQLETTTTTPLPKSTVDINKILHNMPKMKFEIDSPNEFTNGYELRLIEILFIVFILFLWICSLRKFVKNFDKLRTTHYREIPYKYKLKDPQNINQVRVVHNQTESVIYSRDPIKKLNPGSLKSEEGLLSSKRSSTSSKTITISPSKTKLIVESPDLTIQSTENLNENFSCEKIKFDIEDLSIGNRNSGHSRSYESLKHLDSLDEREECSSLGSLSNMNKIRKQPKVSIEKNMDRFNNNESIKRRYAYQTQKNQSLSTKSNSLLNPNMLSPFIRQSLLDLHQKSVENITAANLGMEPPIEQPPVSNLLKKHYSIKKVDRSKTNESKENLKDENSDAARKSKLQKLKKFTESYV